MQPQPSNNLRHLSQLVRDYPDQQHVIEQFTRDNALAGPPGSLQDGRYALQPAFPAGSAPRPIQGGVPGRPSWLPAPDEYAATPGEPVTSQPSSPAPERREAATPLSQLEDHDAPPARRPTSTPLKGPELIAAMIARRHALGMTQAEFAARLGISLRTLQEWEQGRRRPSGPAEGLLRRTLEEDKTTLRMASP